MDLLADSDREALLRCLTQPDEMAAVGLVEQLLRAGAAPEQLLLDLIAPIQARIGRLWQDNRLSVVDEHLASYISERLVTVVVGHARPAPQGRGDLLVACPEGEWHALPARLVGDILRLRGWRVLFLGAHVPSTQLAGYLAGPRLDGALFSATLASRIPQVHQAVRACQRAGVPTLVGGMAFGANGAFARWIGADAWAPDGLAAARVLEQWPPQPGRAHVDRRPTDAEYALLTGEHWHLIDHAMKTLMQRYPGLREFSPDQIDGTIAELGYLLEFLASAVYVDDVGLFVDFVRWLVRVLTAHGEPVAVVRVVLAGWAETLAGQPRTQRILAAGCAALPDPGECSAR